MYIYTNRKTFKILFMNTHHSERTNSDEDDGQPKWQIKKQ